MENLPSVTQVPITALDRHTTHTGLEGRRGQRETLHQHDAFAFFCSASDQYPEKRINELLGMVAEKFAQSPRTVLNWYKAFKWSSRYREWRQKQKELSLDDPNRKVVEMVKDLEKLARQGSTVLYGWLTSLDPKKIAGKEVDLVTQIVLKSVELAGKQHGTIDDGSNKGISVKGNNVQLIIKD